MSTPRIPAASRPPRLALLLAVLALAVLVAHLAFAAPARAARDMELSIMDDQLLLGASQSKIDRAMRRFVSLGVDRVRVSAFWSSIAPRSGSTRRPRFNAADPFDPHYDWRALDPVVESAIRHGLRVLISISTPGPYWASESPRRRNGVWRPDPQEFAAFAAAVAYRYGSVVDQFAIMNEPNQGAWLQPQSDRHGYVAPHIYRAIVRRAYPAIKYVAPSSTVLVGELAPSGRDDRGATRPIRPLAFLRTMACVDRRYRPLRRGACRGFQPIPADAIGHHPYMLFRPPTTRSRKRDDAAIGDGRRLLRVLDRLTRRGRIVSSTGRPLDVYYTEFGYQTDPPDPFAGISLGKQERYLQQAAYVAWSTPRVRAMNQFRLSDGAIDRRAGYAGFNEFQSGLLFRGGRPKPGYKSFPHPFVASSTRPRRGARVLLWGQVRPGGAHQVVLERRRGRGRFHVLARLRTDASGVFTLRVRASRAAYRFRYEDGGFSGTSSTVSLRPH